MVDSPFTAVLDGRADVHPVLTSLAITDGRLDRALVATIKDDLAQRLCDVECALTDARPDLTMPQDEESESLSDSGRDWLNAEIAYNEDLTVAHVDPAQAGRLRALLTDFGAVLQASECKISGLIVDSLREKEAHTNEELRVIRAEYRLHRARLDTAPTRARMIVHPSYDHCVILKAKLSGRDRWVPIRRRAANGKVLAKATSIEGNLAYGARGNVTDSQPKSTTPFWSPARDHELVYVDALGRDFTEIAGLELEGASRDRRDLVDRLKEIDESRDLDRILVQNEIDRIDAAVDMFVAKWAHRPAPRPITPWTHIRLRRQAKAMQGRIDGERNVRNLLIPDYRKALENLRHAKETGQGVHAAQVKLDKVVRSGRAATKRIQALEAKRERLLHQAALAVVDTHNVITKVIPDDWTPSDLPNYRPMEHRPYAPTFTTELPVHQALIGWDTQATFRQVNDAVIDHEADEDIAMILDQAGHSAHQVLREALRNYENMHAEQFAYLYGDTIDVLRRLAKVGG